MVCTPVFWYFCLSNLRFYLYHCCDPLVWCPFSVVSGFQICIYMQAAIILLTSVICHYENFGDDWNLWFSLNSQGEQEAVYLANFFPWVVNFLLDKLWKFHFHLHVIRGHFWTSSYNLRYTCNQAVLITCPLALL